MYTCYYFMITDGDIVNAYVFRNAKEMYDHMIFNNITPHKIANFVKGKTLAEIAGFMADLANYHNIVIYSLREKTGKLLVTTIKKLD